MALKISFLDTESYNVVCQINKKAIYQKEMNNDKYLAHYRAVHIFDT